MAASARSRFVTVATLGYGLFAALWIFVTDRLIAAFTDVAVATWYSTTKGMVFVLVTTAALYSALRAVPQSDEDEERNASGVRPASNPWGNWAAYAFAIFLTAAVFALRSIIADAVDNRPLVIIFVLPIAVSALWGGLGPGLFATTLTGVGATLLIAPMGSVRMSHSLDVLQWVLLLAIGLFISIISEGLHRSRRRAIERLKASRGLEHDLRENEARLHLALSSARQGLYDLNVQTGAAIVSPEYATMMGYDPATFEETNDKWIARLHPDDVQRVASVYRDYIAGEIPEYRVEFRQYTADSRWKWILSLGSVVERDASGTPLRMLGTHTDITERKEAEQALREGEQRYRELFEANPHPMWVYDLETLAFLAVNDAAVQKYGYTTDEFLRLTLKDIRPPAEVPALLNNIERDSATSQSSGPWRHRVKDGREILVEITSHALPFAGRPARVVMANDITARVAAEREVRQLSQAVEHSPASVVITDRQGRIEYVNPKFTRVTGYSRAEAIGQTSRLLKSGEMTQDAYRRLWQTISSGGTWQGEFHNRKKSGELYWEYASISPIIDAGGEITHFVAVKEDITERKEAQLALQQSEEKFREFFMTSRDCVFITTPAGAFIDFNDAALPLFGFDRRTDLARQRIQDLYASPAERENLMQMIRAQGYVQDHPVTLRRASGTLVDVLVTVSSLRNPGGSVRAMVGTVRDISERKRADEDRQRLEAQLQQAQKMDAVGRLAGGVAHDFNNMLNVIIGYSDMLVERLPADDPTLDDLREIRHAATRSADLTGQLLAFARRQTVAPKVLDLNVVIGERAKMLRRLIGEEIGFSVVPGADLWAVSIDPSQLDQILANLSVNSRDAIGGVGSIAITTKNVHLDAAYCSQHPGFEIGDFVQLTLSDTGCGMDRETLDRIFEPFFTTKEPGKGTGLGLATIYGIVKQNGGFINVDSEPGRGTTFTIYLPRHDGATAVAQESEDRLLTGSETILVVEDEAQILRMCQRVLESAGYRVLAAASPVSAVVLAEQHPGPIHLLLSDVVMPDMNGKQLQARMEAVMPGLRTVFMSGYTADVVAHRGVLDAGIRFLQKPFSPRDLTRRIREALDERQAPSS
jgi:PAS domain S-box-containing protein